MPSGDETGRGKRRGDAATLHRYVRLRRQNGGTMRVLIVGAGIGGLTAALALPQAGFDAHCYEQAAVLREVGAGLAVGSNAVRVLHRLGLAEALRALGVASHSWDLRAWQ